MAAANSRIADLRELLAGRFGNSVPSRDERIRTGLSVLDQATRGGLRKGEITELIGQHASVGSALLIHFLLEVARRERFFFALIDGADSFDPQAAREDALPHLLWVRCEEARQAVKAADFLLRDGNFPIVILDLVLNSPQELRRIPPTNWYRLQRLVEAAPVAFIVMSRHNLVPSARTKIILDYHWTLNDLTREELVVPKMSVRRSAPAAAIAR